MIKKRFLSGMLATLMLTGQFAWAATAAAEESPSPTPAATVSPTPTETVTPTPTEAPATVTPTPTPAATLSPTPEATVTPAAAGPTVSPSPTQSSTSATVTTPEAKADKDVTGANGCGGVIPNWVFDTTSRTWVAADKSSFSCDKASGYFLSPKYYFDKRIGWYEIIPDSAPKPDYMITAPNVVHTVLGDLVVGSQDYQVAKALGLLEGAAGSGILMPAGSSGAAAGVAAGTAAPGQSWFDLTNLVNVVNVLQSNATSGSVAAGSNTQVGNVGSGAANVVANLINLLASAWSWSNGSLSFFMQNILAPLTGDINLNPTMVANGGGGALGSASIAGTGPGSTNTIDVNNPNSLQVNAKNGGSITNNVNINATSGGASADSNTRVGNVSTGMATAQVNIINLINSFISSGSSFFGILNIFGNLNGDILFPDGFLNGLVPSGAAPASTTANISGTGAGSTNQVGVNNSASATVNNSNLNSANNNILTTAASGSVTAGSNTVMGGASSGAATTNQSLFNLANSSIFGENAVLVMVNVLGHWVGKIMTLPGTGLSQSALLTGGASVAPNNGPQTSASIAGTGADSTNTANFDNSTKADVNQQSVGTITNNVTVNAQSGNASATKNTEVGNVSTGDAKAGASVANLFYTVMNVKHWFGVLVINVFGDWTGDVNNDTAAGGYSRGGHGSAQGSELPAAAAQTGATNLLALTGAPQSGAKKAYGTAAVSGSGSGQGSAVAYAPEAQPVEGQVLTAAAQSAPAQAAAAAVGSQRLSFLFIVSAIIMMVAGALLAIEKKLRH